MPYMTVICATFSVSATLFRLLATLATQTFQDFNVIIQDCLSTDDTVAVAESYRATLPELLIRSEKDNGIYDAWNKALDAWQDQLGTWILFLGADDKLDSNIVLEQCSQFLCNAPNNVLFAGGAVQMVTAKGEPTTLLQYRPDGQDKKNWRDMPFPHPGLFHHRSLFTANRFDSSLKIAADYDFVCKLWTRENGNLVLPLTVTRMQWGGVSSRPESVVRCRWEAAKVSSRYFPNVWTPACLLGLFKGVVVLCFCRIFGKRAPKLLDFIRKIRGLGPSWSGL